MFLSRRTMFLAHILFDRDMIGTRRILLSVGTLQHIDRQVEVMRDGAASVGETMLEEPEIRFLEIEDASKEGVVDAVEAGVAEARGVAAFFHSPNHLIGLTDRDSPIGGAVDNPERHLRQATEIATDTATATEFDSGSHLIGVGIDKSDSAVTAKAHTEDIDTIGIDREMRLGPLESLVDFIGVPRATWVLRSKDESVEG